MDTTATCQHCHQPVRFDVTEHGYRGFVHEDSGTAACQQVPSE